MSRTRVKICGITTAADALLAVEAGADAIGLVFAESSRRIERKRAVEIIGSVRGQPFVTIVGVFMDQPREEVLEAARLLRLDAVQLHGRENDWYRRAIRSGYERQVGLIQRVSVGPYDTRARLWKRAAHRSGTVLFDPGAGDGRPFDWSMVAGFPGRFILAGGLTPENVGEATRVARPWAVDVSSGVEKRVGRKDKHRLRAFLTAVRETDAAMAGDGNRAKNE